MRQTLLTIARIHVLAVLWYLVVLAVASSAMVSLGPVYTALRLDPLGVALTTMSIAILAASGIVSLLWIGARRAGARAGRGSWLEVRTPARPGSVEPNTTQPEPPPVDSTAGHGASTSPAGRPS